MTKPIYLRICFLLVTDFPGTKSRTEWQVTTNHDKPMHEPKPSTIMPSRGSGSGSENGGRGSEGNELKVVLLGAPGVGKTSIIQVALSIFI